MSDFMAVGIGAGLLGKRCFKTGLARYIEGLS
jgi:hypothetical protein